LDDVVGPADVARLTHPRTGGARAQVAVLLVAVLVGLGLGAVLLSADQRSWDGARFTTASITGLEHDGIHADVAGSDVVLHLESVPPKGTVVDVEVSPDGRARPASYRQTWLKASRSGLALAVGLTLLVQVYRFFVTRRPVEA
jgi:hypothetical protein